jgi:hypothetical protein
MQLIYVYPLSIKKLIYLFTYVLHKLIVFSKASAV